MVMTSEINNINISTNNESSIRVFNKENYEKFNREKILNSLVIETSLDRKTSTGIIDTVVDRITTSRNSVITTRMIREMVLSVLIERGYMDAYRAYSTLGLPVYDIEKLITNGGDTDNANVSPNPQATMGRISDEILKKHALTRTIPPELARGHADCEYHIKDLHFFNLGMFCQAWDARMLLRYGLPPSRSLKGYKYSHPSKKLSVTCLHLANWFSYAQSVFSGGQGYMGFNTILAPFARGLSDNEIKQSMETFVFQVNQQRDSRGHQLPFTSIDLNLGIDPNFKDCHAIVNGELLSSTYADYEEEATRIVSALVDVYKNGDANNTPFSFAKFEIRVSDEKIKQHPEIWKKIVDLAAHNGTPYFLNGNKIPESAHSQCCRIIFNPDGSITKYCVEPSKFKPTDEHIVNMGSSQSICINLPRLALDAKNDERVLFDLFDQRLHNMLDILKLKRRITIENLKHGSPALYCVKIGDEPLIDMDIQSCNIGYVGLNELLENMYGRNCHLGTPEGHELGKKYLQFLTDWCEHESIHNKMMINVWEQPAESTAQRFAAYDLKKFGRGIAVQGDMNGDGQHVYYTNSSHIPYNYPVELHTILKYQGDYHPIVRGGVITHLWLGERYPDQEALGNLIQKILSETNNYYFTFSKVFTICGECGKTEIGDHESCVFCSSKNVDHIDRITGYYALRSNSNPGKIQEMKERIRFDI